jgi:hypothetical protein
MERLCKAVVSEDNVHMRIFLLEKLTRDLEANLVKTNKMVRPMSGFLALHEYHMKHFKVLSTQHLVMKKCTVCTGMFFFVNHCRNVLREEEHKWRVADHKTLATIAPQWVEDGVVPDYGEPILFMSTTRVMACLRAIQKAWYTRVLDLETLKRVLHWIICRTALLITFPYDAETFDVKHYRQKHGGTYLASVAFVYDTYALISSFQRDIWVLEGLRRFGPITVSPRLFEETHARNFLSGLMGKVQGDSLCIHFQKAFVESHVRLGDPLIFARRRSAVIAPTHMDIITECHGVEVSRSIHCKSDIRLMDIYKDPEYEELIWIVVTHYYFMQKLNFPWMQACLDLYRLEEVGTENFSPRILYIPIENQFAVEYADGTVVPYGSILQTILNWMRAVPPQCKFSNIRYDFSDIIRDFIGI